MWAVTVVFYLYFYKRICGIEAVDSFYTYIYLHYSFFYSIPRVVSPIDNIPFDPFLYLDPILKLVWEHIEQAQPTAFSQLQFRFR